MSMLDLCVHYGMPSIPPSARGRRHGNSCSLVTAETREMLDIKKNTYSYMAVFIFILFVCVCVCEGQREIEDKVYGFTVTGTDIFRCEKLSRGSILTE